MRPASQCENNKGSIVGGMMWAEKAERVCEGARKAGDGGESKDTPGCVVRGDGARTRRESRNHSRRALKKPIPARAFDTTLQQFQFGNGDCAFLSRILQLLEYQLPKILRFIITCTQCVKRTTKAHVLPVGPLQQHTYCIYALLDT